MEWPKSWKWITVYRLSSTLFDIGSKWWMQNNFTPQGTSSYCQRLKSSRAMNYRHHHIIRLALIWVTVDTLLNISSATLRRTNWPNVWLHLDEGPNKNWRQFCSNSSWPHIYWALCEERTNNESALDKACAGSKWRVQPLWVYDGKFFSRSRYTWRLLQGSLATATGLENWVKCYHRQSNSKSQGCSASVTRDSAWVDWAAECVWLGGWVESTRKTYPLTVEECWSWSLQYLIQFLVDTLDEYSDGLDGDVKI